MIDGSRKYDSHTEGCSKFIVQHEKYWYEHQNIWDKMSYRSIGVGVLFRYDPLEMFYGNLFEFCKKYKIGNNV